MIKSPLTYVLILVGFISITSCSKKADPAPADQIQRRWTIQNEDGTTHYLVLRTDGESDEKRFETNIPSLPDTAGTWSLSGDTLLNLHGSVTFKSELIDSTVILGQGDEAEIIYFNKRKKEIGRLKGNKLEPARHGASLVIDKLSSNELVLRGKELISLGYTPKEFGSGFSFMSVLRGILGMISLLALGWVFSANRKAIDWKLVGKGLVIQLVLAIGVLKVPLIADIFDLISKIFVKIIGFTQDGTEFLFANFDSQVIEEPLVNFVIMVLPTVIFFSALTSLFYYWGILQKIVWLFAKVMQKIMKLSGAESMAAAGNIFLGQTEAPLLVKPYLMGMTKSEIMCLMTGGMATIAGGVLAAYIGFLGGGDPAQELYFAKHLLTASIMSAPAAIVAAKILVPETESFNKKLEVPKEKIGTNELEAIANGTTDGIKLAVNVAGMLLVFTALVSLANYVLGWVGGLTSLNDVIAANTGYNSLSFDFIMGYLGAPLVWLMGVSADDMVYVGELLGKKTMINEFVAYPRLGEMQDQGLLSQKSVLMATYMLCGFANIASIGIQIGGIGSLIPSRKGLLSQLGFRALVGGTIACLMTAVMVGMLM